MIKLKKYILGLFLLLGMSSCVSKKDIVYFNQDKINQDKLANYALTLKPDDLLQITVSTEDIKSGQAFNLPVVTFSATSNSVIGTPKQQDYLIDANGEITFPVLGKIKLAGLTREQAIKLLEKKLIPRHLKKAIITIRITNFKVTVEGDVKKPGTYNVPNERITIMEAIGLAGDLNISGQRNNVLVVREEKGKKQTYRVDLTSMKTFESPVYYLQQNDLVYVEPNNARLQSASYNQNTGLFISIASVLITLISVLTR